MNSMNELAVILESAAALAKQEGGKIDEFTKVNYARALSLYQPSLASLASLASLV